MRCSRYEQLLRELNSLILITIRENSSCICRGKCTCHLTPLGAISHPDSCKGLGFDVCHLCYCQRKEGREKR
jgi:hypothetical protein